MIIAKIIKISGNSVMEIDEITTLLQDFIDKSNPDDVRKLLLAVNKKPSIVKTALKFL
jgi:hypothetical protein